MPKLSERQREQEMKIAAHEGKKRGSNENWASQTPLPEELSLTHVRSFNPPSNPMWKVLHPHFKDEKTKAQRLSLQPHS